MLQKHCWVRWLCCNLKLVLVRFVSPRSWSLFCPLVFSCSVPSPGSIALTYWSCRIFQWVFSALCWVLSALCRVLSLCWIFSRVCWALTPCRVAWVLFLRRFVGFNVALLGSVILFGSFGTLLGSVLSLYRQVDRFCPFSPASTQF